MKKFPLQSTVNSDTIHTQSIHCLLSKKLLNMANFAFNSQLKHFLTSTNWPSCDLKYSDKYFTGCCRFFYTQKKCTEAKNASYLFTVAVVAITLKIKMNTLEMGFTT